MKKYLLLIVTALLLAACSSDEEEPKGETKDISEEVEYEERTTEDPLESVEQGVLFADDFGETYEIKDFYSNDETKERFNHLDYKGYEVKYSIAVVEEEDGSESIGFFVETENGTDKNIQFNMDIEVETDDEEVQGDSSYGIGRSSPGKKLKGFTKATLDYGVQDDIKVTFFPPWDDDSEFDDEVGESFTVEFTRE